MGANGVLRYVGIAARSPTVPQRLMHPALIPNHIQASRSAATSARLSPHQPSERSLWTLTKRPKCIGTFLGGVIIFSSPCLK